MGRLDGKIALVTGGGGGIGRAVAVRFVAEGAKVVVLDRDAARCRALEAELGASARVLVGDVREFEDNARAVELAQQAWGGLHVFVGNAGIHDAGAALAGIPASKLRAAFDEMFHINVMGYLAGVKASLAALAPVRGCVVLTASYSSFHIGSGGVLYASAKHALVGVIRQLAHELAPDIRVNGVAPGAAPTMIHGVGALGQGVMAAARPEAAALLPLGFLPDTADYAGTYVYLASDDARVVTGQIVLADGGASVRGLIRRSGSA